MALTLYNSLTKKEELFVPLDPNSVGLYSCGPTVYNYAHIGNLRAYISADILKRALTYCGYATTHIMNLTDVDDKTIRDSKGAGKSLEDFTVFYAEAFKKDLAVLHVIEPTRYTRAVEHIPQMIALIQKLIDTKHAYVSDDGSVYFDIQSDTSYGKLSHIILSQKKENAAGRIAQDEYEKENADDFALWKAWDENDGDVAWNSPWGKGRPGWHIECSAMSMEYLGSHFDIHTGGIDLVFPHHENEIAQSECATGEQFVNYWFHNEWVMVDGKKMAKRDGNFITLRTLQEKNINPLALRLWMLMGHYRSPLNFTWEALSAADTALSRLYIQIRDLPHESTGTVDATYASQFASFIENDLDTPRAIALLWEVTKDKTLTPENAYATLLHFDSIFGLGMKEHAMREIPEEIIDLAQKRMLARQEKNWQLSDELRDQILQKGYVIRDTDDGFKIDTQ